MTEEPGQHALLVTSWHLPTMPGALAAAAAAAGAGLVLGCAGTRAVASLVVAAVAAADVVVRESQGSGAAAGVGCVPGVRRASA